MARIFSIYFSYNDTMHNAMVSVRTTPFFTEYTLNFDNALMGQLPGNKIISTDTGQFIFQHTAAQDATPLMKEIIRAVSEHLQATEA